MTSDTVFRNKTVVGFALPGATNAGFDNAIAIHPFGAEEQVTMKLPQPDPVAHHSGDSGVEWKDAV